MGTRITPVLVASSRALRSPADLHPRSGSMVAYPCAPPRLENSASWSLRMRWEAPFSRGPQYHPLIQRRQTSSPSTSAPTGRSTQDGLWRECQSVPLFDHNTQVRSWATEVVAHSSPGMTTGILLPQVPLTLCMSSGSYRRERWQQDGHKTAYPFVRVGARSTRRGSPLMAQEGSSLRGRGTQSLPEARHLRAASAR